MKMTFNPYTGKLASKVRQAKGSGKKKRQWLQKATTKISTKRKSGKWMA